MAQARPWWDQLLHPDPPPVQNGFTYAPDAGNHGLISPPAGYVPPPTTPTLSHDTPDGTWSAATNTYIPRDAGARPGQTFNPQTGYWFGSAAAPTAPAPTAPPATGGGGPQVTGPSPGSAPTPFNWPTFTAPTFNAPAPYSYPSFEAPSLEDAESAPGFQTGLKQGLGAMTNSRAAAGVFRTGATPKAFFDYANANAEQNYNNVFNQRLSAYQANATNAANTYNTNYTTAKDTYNSAFQNAAATFNPQFQASQLTFQDMYNRWRDGLAATTAVATAGAH